MLLPNAIDIDLEGSLAHFAEHGYARLGRVASEDALVALRARADDVMLGRVVIPGLFFQLDADTGRYEDLTYGQGYQGPSLNYRKIEKLERDPLYREWLENALFERVARALIDTNALVGDESTLASTSDIVIYRALLFAKSAAGGTPLPWHQDGGKFWGLDRDPTLQIWTALDDAPEEGGCLEVLPGSHIDGLATPLGGVVPANIVSARDAESRFVSLPARAGEVILIHNYTWHRSGLNRTGRARRAFTVCYMNATTRCLRKKKAPRDFVRVFGGRRQDAIR